MIIQILDRYTNTIRMAVPFWVSLYFGQIECNWSSIIDGSKEIMQGAYQNQT